MPKTQYGTPYVAKDDYVANFPEHSKQLAEQIDLIFQALDGYAYYVSQLQEENYQLTRVFKATSKSPDGAAQATFVRTGNVVTASIKLNEKHAQATAYIDIPAGFRLVPELVEGHSVLSVNDLKSVSYTLYFANSSRLVVIHTPGSNKDAAGLTTWITSDKRPE